MADYFNIVISCMIKTPYINQININIVTHQYGFGAMTVVVRATGCREQRGGVLVCQQ
jgi:hypothetical protein